MRLADAIKKLYKSKIPALPPNAPKLPALPKEKLPTLTSEVAPRAPIGI